MIKWFAYIVMLLIFAPCLSSAYAIKSSHRYFIHPGYKLYNSLYNEIVIDTLTKKSKQQLEEEKKKTEEDKKKVKEIAKAKRQAKPEKVDDEGQVKAKPKRERRPEGLERPPEIPRRNGN